MKSHFNETYEKEIKVLQEAQEIIENNDLNREELFEYYKILTKKDLEYSSLKVELAAQRKVAQDIVAFQDKLDKVKKELMVMKAKLPDKKEIPKLLKTISSLGKESGLQFQLFRPISEISKDDLKIL